MRVSRMMNLDAIWQALDDLALAIGAAENASAVREMLMRNRELMLCYQDLFRQLAQVQQQDATAPAQHRERAVASG